jgi:ABC-type antimicrobial peptide transport system, permease component
VNLLEYLRLAAEGLWMNKLRSFLTILGIIIGIAAVITVVAVGQGGRAVLMAEMEKIGTNLFAIYIDWQEGVPPGERDFTLQDIAVIKELVPEITRLAPASYRPATVKGPKKKKPDPGHWNRCRLRRHRQDQGDRGAFLAAGQDGARAVAVLDETLAQEIFGDVDPLGKRVVINDRPALVIGLTKEESGFLGLQSVKNVYCPLVSGRKFFEERAIAQLEGCTVKREDVPQAMAQTVKILERRHQVKDRYKAVSLEQQMQVAGKITGIITLIIGAVAGISLLVGGIGVMNIMLVSVTERTREIGIRMALGARRRDILSQFLIEAVVLCLAGGLIGILLGAGGAYLVARLAKWPPLISFGTVLVAFAFSAAVGIFFGLYPANRAARMNPVEALRQE